MSPKETMTKLELKNLIRPVAGDLELFNKKMEEILVTDSVLISAVIRHIMSSRGKRLRPAMVFLASRCGDYYSPNLVDAALAVELIHTATLLHDDVIDESEIRRGQSTVNRQWNNLVAVLMGDYLFSRAFRIMVTTQSTDLIDAVSRATERVSFGELRQIEELANYDLKEQDYIRIISDKTASLFAVSCEAGPILKNSSPEERKRFRDFGEEAGIAFQIADDLLDYIGESEKIGKNPGSDLLQGKITLPLIYSLSKSSTDTRREITELLDNGDRQESMDRVLDFVTEQGGIAYTEAAARSHSDRAADIFSSLEDNEYSRNLRQILEFTALRDN